MHPLGRWRWPRKLRQGPEQVFPGLGRFQLRLALEDALPHGIGGLSTAYIEVQKKVPGNSCCNHGQNEKDATLAINAQPN